MGKTVFPLLSLWGRGGWVLLTGRRGVSCVSKGVQSSTKPLIMNACGLMELLLFVPKRFFWHLFCSTAARYGFAISEQPRQATRPGDRY